MNEIKKTLAILKARWPEVTLLITFYLLTPIILKLSIVVKQALLIRQHLQWIILPASLLIAIVLIILNSGFLRTAYQENRKRQSMRVLFQIGRHFCWRMVAFRSLYLAPFLILSLLYSFLVTRDVGTQAALWIHTLCSVGLKLVLIKFILLIPALIIVLDCGFFESFKVLRQCNLSNAKVLVALFFVEIALDLFWRFVPRLSIIATFLHFTVTLAQFIMSGFILLMIGVTAVRFVGSLDLVYENRPASSDSEDEPEEQFRPTEED